MWILRCPWHMGGYSHGMFSFFFALRTQHTNLFLCKTGPVRGRIFSWCLYVFFFSFLCCFKLTTHFEPHMQPYLCSDNDCGGAAARLHGTTLCTPFLASDGWQISSPVVVYAIWNHHDNLLSGTHNLMQNLEYY